MCSKYQHMSALKQVTYLICDICTQCNRQSARLLYFLNMCDIADFYKMWKLWYVMMWTSFNQTMPYFWLDVKDNDSNDSIALIHVNTISYTCPITLSKKLLTFWIKKSYNWSHDLNIWKHFDWSFSPTGLVNWLKT